jgi:hypothetical protein
MGGGRGVRSALGWRRKCEVGEEGRDRRAVVRGKLQVAERRDTAGLGRGIGGGGGGLVRRWGRCGWG